MISLALTVTIYGQWSILSISEQIKRIVSKNLNKMIQWLVRRHDFVVNKEKTDWQMGPIGNQNCHMIFHEIVNTLAIQLLVN